MKSFIFVLLAGFSIFAANSFAEERYFLSHIANGHFEGGSFRTTFVLFNNTDTDVTAVLNLTGDDGAPLPATLGGLGTASQFSVFLSAGASQMLQTDGNGPLVAGAATVTTPVKIGVSAIFTIYDNNGGYVTEAGVSGSEPVTEFVLPVDTTGSFNTGLALFNVGGAKAELTMVLRGADGRQIGEPKVLNLDDKTHLARFIAGADQLFPAISNFQGSLSVQSSVPIAALVLRQNEVPLSYTSLPVVPASSSTLTQNFTQVANGSFADGSFRTSFLLFNISSNPADVVLTLTGDDGSPFAVTIPELGTDSTFRVRLGAGASRFLQTNGTGPLTVGAASITSNSPVGASAIFTVFDTQNHFKTEAGVGDAPVLTSLTFPVDITGSFDTGIAFFNPNSAGVTIGLKLLDANGAIAGSATSIILSGKNHRAKFVSQLFPGTSNFRGSLAVAAPSGIAAMTLRQNSSSLSYTTLPVVAGLASGKAPSPTLLAQTERDLTLTASTVLNEVLTNGFKISGTAGDPEQTEMVIAERDDGTIYTGRLDVDNGKYVIAVPAGTYTIKAFYHPAASGDVTLAYADSTPVQISGDTTRNLDLPSVALFNVSGTVSGVAALSSDLTGVRVTFTSADYKAQGEFQVTSNGSYQGLLPNGSYTASISAPSIFFTFFQSESLAVYNIGTASITGGAATVNLSVPAMAKISPGTVHASWLAGFAPGINVSASDRSAPQPTDAASVLSPSISGAGADPSGAFQMILARDRSYEMSMTVPLLQGSTRLGVIGFPVAPEALNLVADTPYSFNLPSLPGQVTITGKVTDTQGQPLKGVAIAASTQDVTDAPNLRFSTSSTTGLDGSYSMTVLSGTRYQLMFVPPPPVP